MTQVMVLRGKDGGMAARIPCYLSCSPRGSQLAMEVRSCLDGRAVSLAVHRENLEAEMGVFGYLSGVHARAGQPGYEGVTERDGANSVVLYGIVLGRNQDGCLVVDVHGPGCSVTVEPG